MTTSSENNEFGQNRDTEKLQAYPFGTEGRIAIVKAGYQLVEPYEEAWRIDRSELNGSWDCLEFTSSETLQMVFTAVFGPDIIDSSDWDVLRNRQINSFDRTLSRTNLILPVTDEQGEKIAVPANIRIWHPHENPYFKERPVFQITALPHAEVPPNFLFRNYVLEKGLQVVQRERRRGRESALSLIRPLFQETQAFVRMKRMTHELPEDFVLDMNQIMSAIQAQLGWDHSLEEARKKGPIDTNNNISKTGEANILLKELAQSLRAGNNLTAPVLIGRKGRLAVMMQLYLPGENPVVEITDATTEYPTHFRPNADYIGFIYTVTHQERADMIEYLPREAMQIIPTTQAEQDVMFDTARDIKRSLTNTIDEKPE
ncbi:MAG TPA: hypothetical protein VGT05_01925 [Patescibacteria group bacterium]|nr:hypothetical protein [Patescibacteria group bacterium]